MTIWQLYRSFFFLYIRTLFLDPRVVFFFSVFRVFFLKTSFDLAFLTSSLVLLINSHHCFRQQKNAAKIPRNRQKTKEANRKHSEIPTVGWGGGVEVWGGVQGRSGEGEGGRFWDPTSSEHIYNRKDSGRGRCCLAAEVRGDSWGGFSRGGKYRLHRSTGLRSWTANGEGGAQSTKSGPVTSAAVFKGNVIPVVTVSRGTKTKEKDPRHTGIPSGKRIRCGGGGSGAP